MINLNNKSEKRTEIEAMYFHSGQGWKFKQGTEECPSTKPAIEKFEVRHFIKSPVASLSPGAWAQVNIIGTKTLWTKFSGDEPRDSYRLVGSGIFEISTPEGILLSQFNLDVEVEESPF